MVEREKKRIEMQLGHPEEPRVDVVCTFSSGGRLEHHGQIVMQPARGAVHSSAAAGII